MLEYERKQAPHEKAIIRHCLQAGKPYPKKIRDAPELELDELFYYNAFAHLDTCRAFELGPIPYFRMMEYADQFELTIPQAERFIAILTECDIWLRAELRKEEATRQAPPDGNR